MSIWAVDALPLAPSVEPALSVYRQAFDVTAYRRIARAYAEDLDRFAYRL